MGSQRDRTPPTRGRLKGRQRTSREVLQLRQAVFQALVECQDDGVNVSESRKIIADCFHIDEDRILAIENEGLENEWPPLGES